MTIITKAIKNFIDVNKLNSDDTVTWFNKEVAHYIPGRFGNALAAYNQAINLPKALPDKGIMPGEFGRFENTLIAFNQAIKLNPNDAVAWYCIGRLYASQGDKDKALKNLVKAIGLDATYKVRVIADEDFKSLWEDEDFQNLIK